MNLKASQSQSSPMFIWTNDSNILPGATLGQSWEAYKPSSAYYLPFNYTRVTNNSLCELIIYPNQDKDQGIPIPAGSNVSIDADIVPSCWSFSIKNNDSTQTITANQITIISSKIGMVANK